MAGAGMRLLGSSASQENVGVIIKFGKTMKRKRWEGQGGQLRRCKR